MTIDMVKVICPSCRVPGKPECNICSGHGAIYMAKGVTGLTTLDDAAIEELKRIINFKLESGDFRERKPKK